MRLWVGWIVLFIWAGLGCPGFLMSLWSTAVLVRSWLVRTALDGASYLPSPSSIVAKYGLKNWMGQREKVGTYRAFGDPGLKLALCHFHQVTSPTQIQDMRYYKALPLGGKDCKAILWRGSYPGRGVENCGQFSNLSTIVNPGSHLCFSVKFCFIFLSPISLFSLTCSMW